MFFLSYYRNLFLNKYKIAVYPMIKRRVQPEKYIDIIFNRFYQMHVRYNIRYLYSKIPNLIKYTLKRIFTFRLLTANVYNHCSYRLGISLFFIDFFKLFKLKVPVRILPKIVNRCYLGILNYLKYCYVGIPYIVLVVRRNTAFLQGYLDENCLIFSTTSTVFGFKKYKRYAKYILEFFMLLSFSYVFDYHLHEIAFKLKLLNYFRYNYMIHKFLRGVKSFEKVVYPLFYYYKELDESTKVGSKYIENKLIKYHKKKIKNLEDTSSSSFLEDIVVEEEEVYNPNDFTDYDMRQNPDYVYEMWLKDPKGLPKPVYVPEPTNQPRKLTAEEVKREAEMRWKSVVIDGVHYKFEKEGDSYRTKKMREYEIYLFMFMRKQLKPYRTMSNCDYPIPAYICALMELNTRYWEFRINDNFRKWTFTNKDLLLKFGIQGQIYIFCLDLYGRFAYNGWSDFFLCQSDEYYIFDKSLDFWSYMYWYKDCFSPFIFTEVEVRDRYIEEERNRRCMFILEHAELIVILSRKMNISIAKMIELLNFEKDCVIFYVRQCKLYVNLPNYFRYLSSEFHKAYELDIPRMKRFIFRNYLLKIYYVFIERKVPFGGGCKLSKVRRKKIRVNQRNFINAKNFFKGDSDNEDILDVYYVFHIGG